MTQSERIETSDNPSPASNASHSAGATLIAAFVAAVVVASGWYFYEQDQRDTTTDGAEAVPAAAQDAMTPQSDTDAQQASTSVGTTLPPTSDGAAQSSATHSGVVASPPATMKPATKRSLARAAKPAHSVAARPLNRQVALLDHPNPTYPVRALREREQGTVLVLAQVDVQGRVSDTRVIQHSGSFALDRAATNEVRTWQFQPALQNGRPIVASVKVPVNYRLEQ